MAILDLLKAIISETVHDRM